jgi:hypothetical protein
MEKIGTVKYISRVLGTSSTLFGSFLPIKDEKYPCDDRNAESARGTFQSSSKIRFRTQDIWFIIYETAWIGIFEFYY